MDLDLAEDLALGLIAHYLPETNWVFEWDNAVRRFGACHWKTETISLSLKLTVLNDIEDVRNTILHEIAHALAGSTAGHGPKWKAIAADIGCDAQRTYNSFVVVAPPPKYKATCPQCGKSLNRHRRARGLLACAACCTRYNGGRYHRAYALIWSVVVTPTKGTID